MKIKTQDDVERLDKKIKDDLGIDVRKYSNEEAVESFVELLVFPAYFLKWALLPVFFALLLFVAGYFAIELSRVETIVYSILGALLFLFTGMLYGLLLFSRKMKTDMWEIIKYSTGLMKSMAVDLSHVKSQTNTDIKKEELELLFKGIIHIVTIPMVSQAISDKVPVFGGLADRFSRKVLMLIAERVKFDQALAKKQLEKDGMDANAVQVYTKSIENTEARIRKTMNLTFKIVRLPVKLGFSVLLVLLVVLLLVVW